jgi:hypothetical protein
MTNLLIEQHLIEHVRLSHSHGRAVPPQVEGRLKVSIPVDILRWAHPSASNQIELSGICGHPASVVPAAER